MSNNSMKGKLHADDERKAIFVKVQSKKKNKKAKNTIKCAEIIFGDRYENELWEKKWKAAGAYEHVLFKNIAEEVMETVLDKQVFKIALMLLEFTEHMRVRTEQTPGMAVFLMPQKGPYLLRLISSYISEEFYTTFRDWEQQMISESIVIDIDSKIITATQQRVNSDMVSDWKQIETIDESDRRIENTIQVLKRTMTQTHWRKTNLTSSFGPNYEYAVQLLKQKMQIKKIIIDANNVFKTHGKECLIVLNTFFYMNNINFEMLVQKNTIARNSSLGEVNTLFNLSLNSRLCASTLQHDDWAAVILAQQEGYAILSNDRYGDTKRTWNVCSTHEKANFTKKLENCTECRKGVIKREQKINSNTTRLAIKQFEIDTGNYMLVIEIENDAEEEMQKRSNSLRRRPKMCLSGNFSNVAKLAINENSSVKLNKIEDETLICGLSILPNMKMREYNTPLIREINTNNIIWYKIGRKMLYCSSWVDVIDHEFRRIATSNGCLKFGKLKHLTDVGNLGFDQTYTLSGSPLLAWLLKKARERKVNLGDKRAISIAEIELMQVQIDEQKVEFERTIQYIDQEGKRTDNSIDKQVIVSCLSQQDAKSVMQISSPETLAYKAIFNAVQSKKVKSQRNLTTEQLEQESNREEMRKENILESLMDANKGEIIAFDLTNSVDEMLYSNLSLGIMFKIGISKEIMINTMFLNEGEEEALEVEEKYIFNIAEKSEFKLANMVTKKILNLVHNRDCKFMLSTNLCKMRSEEHLSDLRDEMIMKHYRDAIGDNSSNALGDLETKFNSTVVETYLAGKRAEQISDYLDDLTEFGTKIIMHFDKTPKYKISHVSRNPEQKNTEMTTINPDIARQMTILYTSIIKMILSSESEKLCDTMCGMISANGLIQDYDDYKVFRIQTTSSVKKANLVEFSSNNGVIALFGFIIMFPTECHIITQLSPNNKLAVLLSMSLLGTTTTNINVLDTELNIGSIKFTPYLKREFKRQEKEGLLETICENLGKIDSFINKMNSIVPYTGTYLGIKWVCMQIGINKETLQAFASFLLFDAIFHSVSLINNLYITAKGNSENDLSLKINKIAINEIGIFAELSRNTFVATNKTQITCNKIIDRMNTMYMQYCRDNMLNLSDFYATFNIRNDDIKHSQNNMVGTNIGKIRVYRDYRIADKLNFNIGGNMVDINNKLDKLIITETKSKFLNVILMGERSVSNTLIILETANYTTRDCAVLNEYVLKWVMRNAVMTGIITMLQIEEVGKRWTEIERMNSTKKANIAQLLFGEGKLNILFITTSNNKWPLVSTAILPNIKMNVPEVFLGEKLSALMQTNTDFKIFTNNYILRITNTVKTQNERTRKLLAENKFTRNPIEIPLIFREIIKIEEEKVTVELRKKFAAQERIIEEEKKTKKEKKKQKTQQIELDNDDEFEDARKVLVVIIVVILSYILEVISIYSTAFSLACVMAAYKFKQQIHSFVKEKYKYYTE